MPAHRGRRWPLYLLVLASDAMATASACAIAALAVPWSAGPTDHLVFAVVGLSVVLGVLIARGVYAQARLQIAPGVADGIVALAAGLLVAGVCLLALSAVGPLAPRIPASQVGTLIGLSIVLVPTFRAAALGMAHTAARTRRVLVVGSGQVAGDLARQLGRSRLVDVVGIVDDQPADGHAVVGTVDDLPNLCRRLNVDRVVIAFSRRHPSTSAEVLLALEGNVDVDVVVRYYQLAGWASRLHDVAGLSLLSLGRRPRPAAAACKRSFDIVTAAVLLVVLSPLLVAVAAAVKATSPGPVFFRQVRVGRHQRRFRITKFRTMTVGADPGPGPHDDGGGGGLSSGSDGRSLDGSGGPSPDGGGTGAPAAAAGDRGADLRTPLSTVPDRQRMTRVGHLLRRSAIDELPQLFNVLAGHMSVVGPRPFVPDECDGLSGWAERRFDVRPGMTGLWQVCGQHELSFEELCRLDVQYATSWSLRTDARILARTPARLVRGSAPGR
ncbi:MAG TPA: exopolysaccharide biosynthesis polyprenyl glycosylphosphotransferase [Acidimicrobiales bacterium]|nr:exopolysaccharide biosynthesis polyprenyl glycosylphosphotransferase [Acidimicrobiales bacterium]